MHFESMLYVSLKLCMNVYVKAACKQCAIDFMFHFQKLEIIEPVSVQTGGCH